MHVISDNKLKTCWLKVWFCDLEILEIHQKPNSKHKHETKTISDTPNIDKQEQSKRNYQQINDNQKTKPLSHTEQKLK